MTIYFPYELKVIDTRREPFLITQVPFEKFTEEDIKAFELVNVKREEIENLNELMGFPRTIETVVRTQISPKVIRKRVVRFTPQK